MPASIDKPRFRYDFGGKRLIPIQRLPYGSAEGSFDIQSRGMGWAWANITIWPKQRQHALYDADGNPHPVMMVRGVRMWNQEVYVYLLERKEIVWSQIALLEQTFASPRHKGHSGTSLDPFPEDFEESTTRQATCKWCDFEQPYRGKESSRTNILVCRRCRKRTILK